MRKTQEGRNPMSIMSEKGMIPIPWLRSIKESGKETPKLLLWSGAEDPNLSSIREYKSYLDELKIDHEFLLAKEVDHNPFIFYEKLGKNLINFHQGEINYVH
jgi:hypothetical protein